MAVVGFCEARAAMAYGDGVLLDADRPRGASGLPGLTFEPTSWETAARAYARRVAA